MGAVEAKKIAATFKFEGKYTVAGEEKDQKDNDFDCVLHKFSEYFMPTVMRRYERARFTERKQKEGEPFENFLRDCYALIKKCSYAEEEEMMLDKVVQGITHKGTRDRLELMTNLTLPEAIKIARRQEMISNQDKELSEVKKSQDTARPHNSNRGRGNSFRGRDNHNRGRGYNSSGGRGNSFGGRGNGYRGHGNNHRGRMVRKLTDLWFKRSIQNRYWC
jgi:hypothetical protein